MKNQLKEHNLGQAHYMHALLIEAQDQLKEAKKYFDLVPACYVTGMHRLENFIGELHGIIRTQQRTKAG